MYLTRLRLNPNTGLARRDLGSPYEMHRTLVRAFVADENSSAPRFLWRQEVNTAWADPILLVQSSEAPDWSYLEAVPQYLKQAPEVKQLDAQQLVNDGGRYRFRLQANPTVTRDGKRLGLLGEEAQLAWLIRQANRHGFRVEAALVTGSDRLSTPKASQRITLQRACFEGRLVVEDTNRFAQALLEGIGPAKAFGCGLLSVGKL